MGAIFNAQANKSPLVVTAGQQVRAHITMQANLTNPDAIRVPHPFVKGSHEPARPQDVPLALSRAIAQATLPPRGPAFVSLPMDDWDAEVDDTDAGAVLARTVTGRAGADPSLVRDLARRLEAASNPVFVAGPDIDASGGWDAAVALAEKLRLPVWASPAAGGGRLGFPEDHPHFRGVLPPAIGPIGQTLAGHDLILVAGSSVFPYYPYIPGPALPEGATLVAITPTRRRRARAGRRRDRRRRAAHARGAARRGRRVLARPAGAARRAPPLGDDDPIPPATRPACSPRCSRTTRSSSSRRRARRSPSATACASRAPAATTSAPPAASATASPPAIGVQLAQPDRPVVCVLGEGSAQYAITGFWTAAAYGVPVTFLVLRNDEYSILKWFAEMEQVAGAPGLELPALETAKVAEGYGVRSISVTGHEPLRASLAPPSHPPPRSSSRSPSRRAWPSPNPSPASPQQWGRHPQH